MSKITVRYIVADVDAAIPFYTELLGFQVDLHPRRVSRACREVLCSCSSIGLVPAAPAKRFPTAGYLPRAAGIASRSRSMICRRPSRD